MHLLTFLTLKEKNHLLFRTLVIGGQARPRARCFVGARPCGADCPSSRSAGETCVIRCPSQAELLLVQTVASGWWQAHRSMSPLLLSLAECATLGVADSSTCLQGVFFLLYTIFYSISSRHCHAFVGCALVPEQVMHFCLRRFPAPSVMGWNWHDLSSGVGLCWKQPLSLCAAHVIVCRAELLSCGACCGSGIISWAGGLHGWLVTCTGTNGVCSVLRYLEEEAVKTCEEPRVANLEICS
jgi:hypothetical protein